MSMLWPWILARLQDSMLSVKTHLLHTFQKSTEVSGLVAVLLFCNQDRWSWIVAVLQDSMLSDITHLLHTFKFICFLVSWLPGPCFTLMQETMASLRMVWLGAPQLRQVQCFIIPGIKTCTVAILAQGTNWAVAATQAFVGVRFNSCC